MVHKKINSVFKRIEIMSLVLFSVALLLLAGLFIFMTVTREEKQENLAKPTIALVNEDESGSFNKRSYTFGKDFVNRVSRDTAYNWQVVSRSVADRAYSEHSVDAVIYIPQSFSKNILTLQAMTPTKARMDYKVQTDHTALNRQALQHKVSEVLGDFNRSIVKMYYASVAGNIAEAQNNMNGAVDHQTQILGALSGTILPDFTQTHQGYGSVLSFSNMLQGQNSSWISSQNAFTESTKAGLKATSESLSRQEKPLTDYFESQKEILYTNIYNGNQALTYQGEQDKQFYDNNFDNYIHQLSKGDAVNWRGFAGLSSVDGNGDLDQFNHRESEYQDLADKYNKAIAVTKANFEAQLQNMGTSRTELLALESKLLREYFALHQDISLETFDLPSSSFKKSDSKLALAEKIGETFDHNDILKAGPIKAYQDKILSLLRQLPHNQEAVTSLFDHLEKNTAFDRQDYDNKLKLIAKYIQDLNHDENQDNNIGETPDLDLIFPEEVTQQTVKKTLRVKVPADAVYTVKAELNGRPLVPNESFPTFSPKPLYTSFKADQDSGHKGSYHIYNKQDYKGEEPQITDPEVDTAPPMIPQPRASVTLPADITKPAIPALDTLVSFEYSIDLGEAEEAYFEFFVTNDEEENKVVFEQSEHLVLMPRDVTQEYIGSKGFGTISNYLSKVDTISHLLLFLYGRPDEQIETYAKNPPANFFEEASSVYKSYGAIHSALILDYLDESGEEVGNYHDLGKDNITRIIAQIKAVSSVMYGIQKDHERLNQVNVPVDYFSQSKEELNNWYSQAMTLIDTSVDSWQAKQSDLVQLKAEKWAGQAQGKAELYGDEAANANLYASISRLIKSSSETADKTFESAQIIKDNKQDFEELMAQVDKTKRDAERTMADTDQTIKVGSSALASSQAYKEQFGTVLRNTRTEGNDKEEIFDFFAQPIQAEDTTAQASAITVSYFDWRWVIVFGAGLIFGLISMLVFNLSRRKKGG